MKRRERLILAFRFLRSEPMQSLTLAAVFLFALAGSLIFSELAVRRNNRLVTQITRSYGTVAIRPSFDERDINYPHLGHSPGENTDWLSGDLLASVTELAQSLELSVALRIRGSVVTADGETFAFLARYSDDWLSAGESTVRPDTGPLQIAVQQNEHEIRFLPVPEEAVLGSHENPAHLWLDAHWLSEALKTDGKDYPLATEVAIDAEGDPFALAFDLRELLRNRGQSAEVTAWGESLGVQRYAATQTGAAVEQFLILIVAVLAVAGVTSVSVHNRTEVTVLLRTVGISDDTIRRVYLLELFGLAAAAALVAGVLLFVAAARFGLEMSPETVRRTLLLAAVAPPVTGFFSVRRQLRHPLGSMRREALW